MNWKKPLTSTLKTVSLSIALACSGSYIAHAETLGEPEKEELKFGFIKLTDMAPIAIAYEKGFFECQNII